MYNYLKKLQQLQHTELTFRKYQLAIWLMLVYGFIVDRLIYALKEPVLRKCNFTVIMIIFSIMAIIGVIMSQYNEEILKNFISYNLIIISFGIAFSAAGIDYHKENIDDITIVTIVITFMMVLLASFVPNFFKRIEKLLLIFLIIIAIYEIIFLVVGAPKLLFGIFSQIFWSLSIGYYWIRLQTKKYTLYQAINGTIYLYIVIMSLAISMLLMQ